MALSDYLILVCLILLIVFAFTFLHRQTLTYKYRDVIVKRWQDADFYLGNPNGSEFKYDLKDSKCTWSLVVKRDGWKCTNCQRKVYSKELCHWWTPWRRKIQVDHKIAFILGGRGDTVADGRVCCHVCNIRRSAKIDRVCLERVRELKKKIYIGKKVPKYKSTRKQR